ncbi:MAG TPA: hypothetical protein PKH61_00020 [Microbacteriaceae bacterium]|nr:hypothetical protein [Microbacteriaceae bacterium]
MMVAIGDLMPPATHMTWDVNHAARTITVTVRLALWKANGGMPTDAERKYVEAYAGGFWGPPLKFACYDVLVVVDCRSISKKSDARADEVDVQVDWPGPCEVKVFEPAGGSVLGDSPNDRLHPKGARFNPTEPLAWSHELGHILGLDDGYVPGQKEPYPGHPKDLMWEFDLPVSAETVARMIRRNGMVDESKMQCALSFDATPASLWLFIAEVKDLSIHAWTCRWEAVSSNPEAAAAPLSFEGVLSLEAGYLNGDHNAPARALLEAALGLNTAPLSDLYGIGYPVTFTVGRALEGTLSIRAGSGLVLEGEYQWNAQTGFPTMKGPLRVNGISTASFIPGPAMQGVFTEGATECTR